MRRYIKYSLKHFKKVLIVYILLLASLFALSLSFPNSFNDNIALPDSIQKQLDSNNSNDNLTFIISKSESPEINALVKEFNLVKVDDLNFIKYQTSQSDKKVLERLATSVEKINKCSNCSKIGAFGAITKLESKPKENISEVLGVLFALIILYFAFGSVVSAILPVLIALMSLLMSFMLLAPITHIVSIPSFAPMMMSLLAIGVGIDYTLFILSRFKHELEIGVEKGIAVESAFSTSGRATTFAGVTVIISLLGIMLSGVKFLNGLAIASTLGVLFTLLNTFILLPKLMYKFANKIKRKNTATDDERSKGFDLLGKLISKKPKRFLTLGMLIVVILIGFSTTLRMGPFDVSLAEKNSGSAVYYNLYKDNGLVGTIDPYYVTIPVANEKTFEENIKNFTILQKIVNPKDVTYIISSKGTAHSKESYNGYKQLQRISTPFNSKVMGTNMVYDLLSEYIFSKLVLFTLIISVISFMILLILFRSLILAFISTLSNILISLASFGALSLAFEQGLFTRFIGLGSSIPLNPFLPILFLAILFGLAMDYQVFLLSRLREEFATSNNTKVAMVRSLEHTGKVITNAALIMVVVFISFAFAPDINIRMSGIGLSASIFLDAFIMRIFIIPSLVFIIDKKIWFMPKLLDKCLPTIKID
jgi:RND superfamily putative drug exporter